jgi:hypothetical protein
MRTRARSMRKRKSQAGVVTTEAETQRTAPYALELNP